MTHRCQALDNNEIVTLNCDSCSTGACAAPVCAPAQVACAPAQPCPPVQPCVPAPVKCEPVKPACPPVAAAPAVIAREEAKPLVTETKPCDPCADAGNLSGSVCDKNSCNTGDCDDQSRKGRRMRERRVRDWGYSEINVPVPGVRLQTVQGMPGGPPPQPSVPAFCTMNSRSIRSYYCAPNIVPFACLHQPFGDCLNGQILAGIHTMNPNNGDAVAHTMYLINVLSQSMEWENRQWAATRLQDATMPTVRPYVEDVLVATAQKDRAPLVRVAAIRTLAQLKSTRPDVMALLASAAYDADPRIKEAAMDAMKSMMKGNIQQAGHASE